MSSCHYHCDPWVSVTVIRFEILVNVILVVVVISSCHHVITTVTPGSALLSSGSSSVSLSSCSLPSSLLLSLGSQWTQFLSQSLYKQIGNKMKLASSILRDRRSLRRRPPVPLAGFRTKTIRHAHNPFYRWDTLTFTFIFTHFHFHNPFYRWETPCSRFHNSLLFLSPAKPLWQMYKERTWRWHY